MYWRALFTCMKVSPVDDTNKMSFLVSHKQEGRQSRDATLGFTWARSEKKFKVRLFYVEECIFVIWAECEQDRKGAIANLDWTTSNVVSDMIRNKSIGMYMP